MRFISARNVFLWLFSLGIFLIFFLQGSTVLFAQSLGGISLTSVPKYPEPNEGVVVSLDQYGVNTFGSIIRWYINDVEQVDFHNERSVRFFAGALGEKSVVRVSVTQADSVSLSSSKTIVPTVIDMILESDTYVPYFYKGRALPSSGAGVRVIALVHGGNDVERASYGYKWQLGTSVLFGGMVRGKYVAELTMPQFDRKPLLVEVSDANGTVIAKNSIVLTNEKPELLFYEESPLRGHSGRAIVGDLPLLGEETTIYGEPYYLKKTTLGSLIYFSWKIDSRNTTPNTTPNSITLQKTGSGGSARVDLEVVLEDDKPQLLRNSFRLVF